MRVWTMRILIAHNAYQHRGGEDSVVEDEIALLRVNGHEVETYFRNNHEVDDMSRVDAARQTLWSARTVDDLLGLIEKFRPDIVHAHNTFPLISPSLYWAAGRAGVPVVQTLHNFRLSCLNALFLREGRVCEDCLGRVPWRGVVRRCYRDSGTTSAVLAGMLVLHRALGTYRNKVARYIALNAFCRNKFIEAGLPAERIVIKPNFVDFPGPQPTTRKGLLFVGRLSAEKGIATLAEAMALLPDARLRVAGDGPERHRLEEVSGIERLGSVAPEQVRCEMSGATALVIPSVWYENFPRTLVEALACGLPVIASRIGALGELVRDQETGLLFESGNARDLAEKMRWALAHPLQMSEMGKKARIQYEAEFTAKANYERLLEIYTSILNGQPV